jgi:c-di-GMP-binding flagellar brake protein YcgR
MSENRREARSEEQATVSIKIQYAPDAHDLEGKIFKSQSEDVSLSGMKLILDTHVPVGALLTLEVALNNSEIKYELVAKVVWADDADDGSEREMGVILHIETNPQADSWKDAISTL